MTVPDLRDDLKRLDGASIPDLWPRISRTNSLRDPQLDDPHAPRGRSRFAAAMVGVAVVAAAGFGLWEAFGRDEAPAPGPLGSALPTGILVFESDEEGWLQQELPAGPLVEVSGIPRGAIDLDASPDGRRVAYVTGDGPYLGDLWVADLTTGERYKAVEGPSSSFMSPVWSADGSEITYIALTNHGDPSKPVFTIERMDLASGSTEVLHTPKYGAVSLDTDPSGDRVVYVEAAGPSDVYLLDLATGSSTLLWSDEGDPGKSVTWVGDGESVAVVAGGRVVIVPVDRPDEATTITRPDLVVYDAAWSGDRTLFLSANVAPNPSVDILALDIETGEVRVAASTASDDFRPTFLSGGALAGAAAPFPCPDPNDYVPDGTLCVLDPGVGNRVVSVGPQLPHCQIAQLPAEAIRETCRVTETLESSTGASAMVVVSSVDGGELKFWVAPGGHTWGPWEGPAPTAPPSDTEEDPGSAPASAEEAWARVDNLKGRIEEAFSAEAPPSDEERAAWIHSLSEAVHHACEVDPGHPNCT
jgi:hypothetical protein